MKWWQIREINSDQQYNYETSNQIHSRWDAREEERITWFLNLM